jgi:hypothetical protein
VDNHTSTGSAENGPASEDLHADGRRRAIARQSGRALKLGQEIEQKQDRAKRGLGGEELRDGDGKFVFDGLPPGEYRLFAVSSAERERINDPGVNDRLLSRATKVTLGERGFQNVRLELSEIR